MSSIMEIREKIARDADLFRTRRDKKNRRFVLYAEGAFKGAK